MLLIGCGEENKYKIDFIEEEEDLVQGRKLKWSFIFF